MRLLRTRGQAWVSAGTGKWTTTETDATSVFQSKTVTATKTLTIPPLPKGKCIRFLFSHTVGVLDQSYSGSYHLVVKSPEQPDPGVFDFPSFGVLNVEQTLELVSTSRLCTPAEEKIVPSSTNPTANVTGSPTAVVDRNVSPVPEPLQARAPLHPLPMP